MSRKRLIADLYCGGGGFTEAILRAAADLGIEIELIGVNHWPIAIETQETNHPNARFICQDLELAKPRVLVPGGRLHGLIAAPECTHHSRARGGRPINDQSRSTAWCVTRWCTDLRVDWVLVENVPEFEDWGPLDVRTQRPLKSRRGEYFRAWVGALEALGFHVEWRVLNAADFGGATTRERLFIMARSDRRAIVWPRPTHARRAADPALFDMGLRPWRPAREIIDFSIPGRSIFDRQRPLRPATLRRIEVGLRSSPGSGSSRRTGNAPLFRPCLTGLVAIRGRLNFRKPDGQTQGRGGNPYGSFLYVYNGTWPTLVEAFKPLGMCLAITQIEHYEYGTPLLERASGDPHGHEGEGERQVHSA